MGNIRDEIGNFDPTSVPDAGKFAPVPPGWYAAEIDRAEVKKTNSGDGSYISMQCGIIGDKANGRKIFTKIHLKNKNSTCMDIGKRQLAECCLALGIGVPDDTDELIGKPLMIKVKIEPARGEYPASNDVDKYKPIGNATVIARPTAAEASSDLPTASAPAEEKKATPAKATTAKAKPPWM